MAEAAVGGSERHAGVVRWTHWVIALSFAALLVTGVEILISHPRFYWGETGNVRMEPLFTLPIPASRGSVPTGYRFVLEDQNSWSRSLHFQSAWLVFFTAVLYGFWGILQGHFRKNLAPGGGQGGDEWTYNTYQRVAYLSVVFVLFPLMFWTGLAMSPAFVAAFPFTVTVFGGQQSARTIHFFVTLALVVFVVGHVVMVYRAGFVKRTRAMITGRMKG
ncbi:MAG: hypothetical protein FJW20_14240 [Acidimicrobiia bacterium]|nr:hypothetical protein [Acidimicrobiia bacterium]